MKIKRQDLVLIAIGSCFLTFSAALADEFSSLETVLDKVDKPQNWPPAKPAAQAGMPPPATPTPQVFNPGYSYMRQGMPYARNTISALRHSNVWRYMARPGFAGEAAGQAGGNPFNLSPFGILHYLWDDTTYVSAANPMTLYQTQSELQSAQHYAQLAQAAASRARYARNLQEREEAAQQARYYAGLSGQAAQQAREVSQSGSLNPADVAQAAAEQAKTAESFANNASNYASRGY